MKDFLQGRVLWFLNPLDYPGFVYQITQGPFITYSVSYCPGGLKFIFIIGKYDIISLKIPKKKKKIVKAL